MFCNICEKEYSEDFFGIHYKRKDGSVKRNLFCNDCRKTKNKYNHKKIMSDPIKSEKERKRLRIFAKEHPEKISEYEHRRYKNNKEIRKQCRYLDKNKKYQIILRWQNNKRKTDPIYRLNVNMGCALSNNLRKNKNGRHWEDIVGYSLEDLKTHLESKFKEGMTWENYGEWHIDHIRPKSWFVFESYEDEEFKKCWSVSNLQPKWAEENLKKGNHYEG